MKTTEMNQPFILLFFVDSLASFLLHLQIATNFLGKL